MASRCCESAHQSCLLQGFQSCHVLVPLVRVEKVVALCKLIWDKVSMFPGRLVTRWQLAGRFWKVDQMGIALPVQGYRCRDRIHRPSVNALNVGETTGASSYTFIKRVQICCTAMQHPLRLPTRHVCVVKLLQSDTNPSQNSIIGTQSETFEKDRRWRTNAVQK